MAYCQCDKIRYSVLNFTVVLKELCTLKVASQMLMFKNDMK